MEVIELLTLTETARVVWHARKPDEVLRALGTSRNGLSAEEARRRLEEVGPNELRREQRVSPIILFLHQFKAFLVLLLLGATIVSIALGEVLDAAVILAIVVLSAFLGFVQEYRASRALEALKRMAAPMADVIRGAEEQRVPSREIVPGDIILLSVGDRVPADARLIEVYNLKVDESTFTGESMPVEKQVDPLPEDLPLADRTNMVFAGTTVIHGRGVAVVVATGMNTEFGQIAHLVQMTEEEHTPLESRMEEIGRRLGVAALGIVGVVVALGIWRGGELLEMFIWGVSLAVAAVPEALPAVVTGTLTIGVQRMARRNAIIRKLPAVETLGSTTVICSDKTGTLTKNEMTVRRIWLGGRWIEVTGTGYEPQGEFRLDSNVLVPQGDLLQLARIAVLCNDAHLLRDQAGRHYILGDPTEGSLLVLAAKASQEPEPVRIDYPRVNEIPFSPVRKRMTTVHLTPEGKGIVCIKGAPEVVLAHCTRYLRDGQAMPLGAATRQAVMMASEEMASQALRVLALAYKEIPNPYVEATEEFLETDLTLAGVLGMVDPPREEVQQALRKAELAGVRSVMVTGDHRLTAIAVARELGLLKEGDITLTGSELDGLSDEEFLRIVDRVTVYARTSPQHKLRIVHALQAREHIVAMTGDGINDAPALRQANIGVAMGITGTDVTKESADMILADDNYATIVRAIEEGRIIYDNIRKFLRYLLSTNSGEILTMFIAVLVGLPVPLLAIQILWVNLITDGLPALALALEPAEQDVMQRPPRPPRESVFARGLWQHILWVGMLMATGTLAIMIWALSRYSLESAQTMVFLTLASFQLFHVMAIRSERQSLISLGPLSNPYLTAAVALAFALQLAVTYLPPLQGAFRTVNLDGLQMTACLLVSSTVLWAVEFEKWLLHR